MDDVIERAERLLKESNNAIILIESKMTRNMTEGEKETFTIGFIEGSSYELRSQLDVEVLEGETNE